MSKKKKVSYRRSVDMFEKKEIPWLQIVAS